MTLALIFVNCIADRQEDIRKRIMEIEGVLEAHMTTGIYDLILKAEGESEAKLREDIIRKVRATGGVKSTTTMIVFMPKALATESP